MTTGKRGRTRGRTRGRAGALPQPPLCLRSRCAQAQGAGRGGGPVLGWAGPAERGEVSELMLKEDSSSPLHKDLETPGFPGRGGPRAKCQPRGGAPGTHSPTNPQGSGSVLCGEEGLVPVLSLHGGGGGQGVGEWSSDRHSLLSSGCCLLSPHFPECVCVDGPRFLHVLGGSTAEPPGTCWRE